MTFVHLMAINSHLQHLLSNDSLREKVFKHMSTLSRTLGHPHCSIIKQLEFDNDLIEVSNGAVFQISTRSFIPCPIPPHSYGKTSPRSYVPYDSSAIPDARFFKHGVKNSFPELEQRILFLNIFYQCLVAGKMPQKFEIILFTAGLGGNLHGPVYITVRKGFTLSESCPYLRNKRS